MSATCYPITVVQRARELREAGWPLRRIGELVAQETGHHPSLNTVAVWVDPRQAAKHAARGRARHLRASVAGAGAGGRLGQGRHSHAFQEARVRALVEQAGVRTTQAARVMDFDYPDQGWTVQRVRYLLGREVAAA